MNSIAEYEHALLEMVVARPHLIDEIGVYKELFYSNDARTIFEAVAAAKEVMPKVSRAGLVEHLLKHGNEALVPVMAALDRPMTFANATFYMGKLIEYERKKKIKVALSTALEAVEDSSQTATELADHALEKITEAMAGSMTHESPTLQRIIPDYINELGQREAMYQSGKVQFLHLGVPEVDDEMGPIMPGEVIVVAARPGCGKTALVTQMAVKAASRDIPVCFFSMEMTRNQMVDRIMVADGVASMRDLRTGRLSQQQKEHAFAVADTLLNRKMSIYDGAPTPALLHSRIRKEVTAHGTKLVVVDYLGLLDGLGSDKNGARWEKVGEESRALKRLALSLHTTVVLCVQLGRDADGGKPSIAQLRDSGSIEQDADRVILLYPKGDYDDNGQRQIGCDVGKNRHGRLSNHNLLFDGRHMVFGSMDRPKEGQGQGARVA